jgi:hypothetical protein
MTKDSNDSDGLGETHLALWVFHLTNADEGHIKGGVLHFEFHPDLI